MHLYNITRLPVLLTDKGFKNNQSPLPQGIHWENPSSPRGTSMLAFKVIHIH
jgi:hypothetical protein